MAKKLLQMFPKYDKKQFANFFIGDETWVHYFEPVRKVSNKQTPNNCQTFFECKVCVEGVAIKVPVKQHYWKVLQRRRTEETEKNIIRNDALPLVLNMSVFYMTMPSLIPSAIVMVFL